MLIEVPDNFIDEIAERVKQKLGTKEERPQERFDPEALELGRRLMMIHSKERISIGEAALLLSCSGGHIRNLVKKAKKGQARHPVPYIDLDGPTVFDREALLKWANEPKEKKKKNLHAVENVVKGQAGK